jgi:uncharacterized protein
MNGAELAIARVTAVEVASALFRRTLAGSLAVSDAERALTVLRRHLVTTYPVFEVSPEVCALALDVVQRHGLRGYDCVQLAAALHVQRLRTAARLSALTLVSADLELNAAANAEGMAVEDPNHHQ